MNLAELYQHFLEETNDEQAAATLVLAATVKEVLHKDTVGHEINRALVHAIKETGLDKVAIMRSLEYLQNKGIVEISSEKRKVVEIGVRSIGNVAKGGK